MHEGNRAHSDEVFRETRDSTGDRVVLSGRVWHGKIVVDHPEMAPFVEEALRAVQSPDHSEPDPVRHQRRRCYSRGIGPSAWLVVIVSYEQEPARIVSAFANRKDPPTWSV